MTTRYVSVDEVAAALSLAPTTITTWARAGKIPSLKVSPKLRRYDLNAVLEALGRERADGDDSDSK